MKEVAIKEKTAIVTKDMSAVELALVTGDLSKLTSDQRVVYYNEMCQSMGLNHLSRPFDYITYQGKLILYARKDCTEQLRKIHGVSLAIAEMKSLDGVYVVTAIATDKTGKTDTSIGAVNIKGLSGDQLAIAYMKAETKAKRRVTLSICGLGFLDESEIQENQPKDVEPTKKIEIQAAAQITEPVESIETRLEKSETDDSLQNTKIEPIVQADFSEQLEKNIEELNKHDNGSPENQGFITDPEKPFIKTKAKTLNETLKDRAGDIVVECWKAFEGSKIRDIPEEELLAMLAGLDLKVKSKAQFPENWHLFYSSACTYLNRKQESV